MTDDRTGPVDVAVVGGGIVGATLACGLAKRGLRIVLIEARAPQSRWTEDSFDERVSALTRSSQAIFQNLDVWDTMCAWRVTPYREMRVWDTSAFGDIHFSAADIGEPDLGHIVENRVTTGALWRGLKDLSTVTVCCPASVQAMERIVDHQRLWLSDGTHLDANLVVGADGANSKIRDYAGIAEHSWPYQQTAVVCTVVCEFGHAETAWQHFLPKGPLALLPLGSDRFSIVWSTTSDHAQRLLVMTDEEFGRVVTKASEERAGELRPCGARHAFPLRRRHAEAYVKPGVALVGDAAHVIHPLAGQGVNLGLLDAASLIDVLAHAREQGRPLGSVSTLRRYERARKGENLLVQYAMDGFKQLFSNNILPVKLVRNIGLVAVDRVTPVKNLLARLAMDSVSEPPSLARRIG